VRPVLALSLLLAPAQDDSHQRVVFGLYSYTVPKEWTRVDHKQYFMIIPPGRTVADAPAIILVHPPSPREGSQEEALALFVRKQHENLKETKRTEAKSSEGSGGTNLLTQGFILESDGRTQYRLYVSSLFEGEAQIALFVALSEESCKKHMSEFEAFLYSAQPIASLPVGPGRPILKGVWLNPGSPGHVSDLAFDVSARTLYAATIPSKRKAGIFASGDGGRTWRPLLADADGFSRIVPSRDHRLYALRRSGRLERSPDGGETWAACPPPKHETLGELLIDVIGVSAGSPQIVYAGIRQQTNPRLYRSGDGGETWEPTTQRAITIQDGSEHNYAEERIGALSIDPENPNLVLAVYGGLPMQSRDGGINFQDVTGSPQESAGPSRRSPIEPRIVLPSRGIAFDPVHPHVRYARVNTDREYLLRSTDGGHRWTKLPWPGEASEPLILVHYSGSPRVVYAHTKSFLWVSSDGGGSWSNVKAPKALSVSGRLEYPQGPDFNYTPTMGEDGAVLIDPKTGWIFVGTASGVEVLTTHP